VLVPLESPDPQATYDLLRREAQLYSPELAAKPHLAVLTKSDLLPPGERLPALRTDDSAPIHAISAVSREGLPELLEALWRAIQTGVPIR
jgi:GTPase involved in cell partitioning and DNA repair